MAQQLMAGQKIAAYISLAQKNDSLWGALLVFAGALFLLSSIPFYPIYIVPILALLCGAIAFRNPPIGLIIGAILALPAVIYQSHVFALFY